MSCIVTKINKTTRKSTVFKKKQYMFRLQSLLTLASPCSTSSCTALFRYDHLFYSLYFMLSRNFSDLFFTEERLEITIYDYHIFLLSFSLCTLYLHIIQLVSRNHFLKGTRTKTTFQNRINRLTKFRISLFLWLIIWWYLSYTMYQCTPYLWMWDVESDLNIFIIFHSTLLRCKTVM